MGTKRTCIARSVIACLSTAAALATPGAFATTQLFYGIDNPGALSGPWPNASAARNSFLAALSGASVGLEDFETSAVGSFNGSSIPLNFAGSSITGTLSSSTSAFAKVVNGSDGTGHSISGSHFVDVATLGGPSNSVLATLVFSRPVVAFGFFGNNISNYVGVPGTFPSQQITLDGGAPINVLNVATSLVQPSAVNFFGVISTVPFTTVQLILPAGSLNDNAAIDDLRVAAAVPEPGAWAMLAAGLVALTGLQKRRQRA